MSSSESENDGDAPKIVLPKRATRGNRMQNMLDDQESGDEEFWNQEFFAEEGADEEYKTESSSEDEADTDFSEEEDEGDEDDDGGGEEKERKRRKVLRPPGHRKPPGKPLATKGPGAPAEAKPPRPPAPKLDYIEQPLEAPTLRNSTRQRVEVAEKERQVVEANKPKRKPVLVEYRALTQEELLAEAAQTEIVNQKDLATMVAQEEEVRKRNEVVKAKHAGPFVRYHSKAVNGEGIVTFEVVNATSLPFLSPQYAPPSAERAMCPITGQPAKYRDPLTGIPYASAAAFKELRLRHEEGRPISSKRAPKRRADMW